MECGLQWKDITCWDEVPRLTLTHEETLEAAIPDYCPDMGRVVEASGTLCLRSITARSGNLDPERSMEIMTLLVKINQLGTTVLVVTHEKDLVNKFGKRVITIDQGRIINDSVGGYVGGHIHE